MGVLESILRSIQSSINVAIVRKLLSECFWQHVNVVDSNAEK